MSPLVDSGALLRTVGDFVWPQGKCTFYFPHIAHSFPPLCLCAGGFLSLECFLWHHRQNLPVWSGKSMAFGVRKIWVLNRSSPLLSCRILGKLSIALKLVLHLISRDNSTLLFGLLCNINTCKVPSQSLIIFLLLKLLFKESCNVAFKKKS